MNLQILATIRAAILIGRHYSLPTGQVTILRGRSETRETDAGLICKPVHSALLKTQHNAGGRVHPVNSDALLIWANSVVSCEENAAWCDEASNSLVKLFSW